MYKIKAPKNFEVSGTLEIPASKSISNRCLIIQALCKGVKLDNLSISDDTKILQDALEKVSQSKLNDSYEINVGLAGTAFRFLTAYLTTQKGTFLLTGEQRIKERPIKPLVDALQLLGADITYTEKEGFAPLLIKGTQLKSTFIEMNASVSSQFITALLLISSKIKNGLHLKLIGKITSKPYIDMTISLMKHFGIQSVFENDEIKIESQKYKSNSLFIEADWSSASYFYQTFALAKRGKLKLLNYSKKSLQGDSKLAILFEQFGVKTELRNNCIVLTKIAFNKNSIFEYNFSNEPDLAQTFLTLCVGLGVNVQTTGLESLKIKETNRIQALSTEFNKLNWELKEIRKEVYSLKKNENLDLKDEVFFETYNDHRMAMCLAPLCLKFGEIRIVNPKVVTKSNPLFWKQFESLGFEIVSI